MAHFVYPAIFYYDSDYQNYAVALPDVNIYTDGDTMEEAYKNAQEFLLSYLDCCEKLETAPETPSEFSVVASKHTAKNESVMLVSVDFEMKIATKNTQENFFEEYESILPETSNKTQNDDIDDGDDIFTLPEI